MVELTGVSDLPTPATGDFLLAWRGSSPYRLNVSFIANVLAMGTSAGAGLVGKNGGGTVQDHINTLTTQNLGSLPRGSTNAVEIDKTATQAALDGTSQFYGLVNRVYAQGTRNYDFVRAQYLGAKLDHTAGTVANADGLHAFVWLGAAGNVTNAVAIAAHIRADGPGDVTNEALWFRAIDADFVGGSTINTARGFSTGQIGGDGTNVTNAYCFDAEDTDATSVTIAFRSSISAGTNKYTLFSGNTAKSVHLGKFGIGSTTNPLWSLSVFDTINNYVADFNNAHASSPFGIRIRYSASAPEGGDNDFIVCSDTASTKFAVKSGGAVFIQGLQILTTRRTGCPAAATDLASAITLVNFLRTSLITHGLIS
ncbi:hypothetical protein [Sphingomonas sp.]|uniref:hypothetical protein n=1 Tax=Sphingomonas sp. TaxID=28214 RepID=UPI0035A847A4